MKITKGNIILGYDEYLYKKFKLKNSLFMEILRILLVTILSVFIVYLEIYLFQRLPQEYNILCYVINFLSICLIVFIYSKIRVFINRKNPNYYIIKNILSLDKCMAIKFYDKIIMLYESKNELKKISLNYMIKNMMSEDIVVEDLSDDKIERLYIDTINNKIIIEGKIN